MRRDPQQPSADDSSRHPPERPHPGRPRWRRSSIIAVLVVAVGAVVGVTVLRDNSSPSAALPAVAAAGASHPAQAPGPPAAPAFAPPPATATPQQVPRRAAAAGAPPAAPASAATVIGRFRTGGFAADSGQNIKRVAEQVDGAVVAPGATFSLNSYTGPRDAAQGYVDAGIIEDGQPARGIGGGISQFSTTLYNAAYFAGMVDVEHTEHSYYISRYPAGREATVFEGAIDLKFRNDGPSPVRIQAQWSPSSIIVELVGQKRYDVTSSSSPRTSPVPHATRTIRPGQNCKPSSGVDGFTITDTRTLRDLRNGQVRTEPRTVRYDPEPDIRCG